MVRHIIRLDHLRVWFPWGDDHSSHIPICCTGSSSLMNVVCCVRQDDHPMDDRQENILQTLKIGHMEEDHSRV